MNKIEKIWRLGYSVDENGIVYKPNGEVQRTYINQGYEWFALRVKEKVLKFAVHRLQAYRLYGSKMFDEGIEVRHLDGSRANNKAANIAIGTHSENMMDIPEAKRKENAAKGVAAARLVNTRYDYDAIRKDRSNGMRYKDIMEKYNISSKGTLSYIINSSY